MDKCSKIESLCGSLIESPWINEMCKGMSPMHISFIQGGALKDPTPCSLGEQPWIIEMCKGFTPLLISEIHDGSVKHAAWDNRNTVVMNLSSICETMTVP